MLGASDQAGLSAAAGVESLPRSEERKEEGCVGSVLKWRRKKMNKHKYRLLREKLRHRRRAGR